MTAFSLPLLSLTQASPLVGEAFDGVVKALDHAVHDSERAAHAAVLVDACYLVAAVLFILALKWLSAPTTARRGNMVGQIGMLLAVVGTLMGYGIIEYQWILTGIVIGSAIGVPMALLMPMTAVPQRTALSHAFGALAASLVGIAHFYAAHGDELHPLIISLVSVEVLLGSLTFTGSLMAFGKLQEILPTRPMTFKGQNIVNFIILGGAIATAVAIVMNPEMKWLFMVFVVLSALFGIMLILPIGGADMPTVISLLNSYAGLSASMMGFVLDNKVLIIAGALDGASGMILSIIMCKAMNRSFTNVLFGAFGQVQAAAVAGEQKTAKSAGADEAAGILAAANTVVIVPGYGMAVAQAQHRVHELYDALTKKGVDVKFAIHPVAGRMPGHMNVLLAEAEIPYDKLVEMDDINSEFPQVVVALVIGANDVTNPAARHDKTSPIYGMPILDVDKARTVMVIKRGMSPGFAGVENELYFLDKTLMLFGDAKGMVGSIVKEIGEAGK
jgi:H+-translocating NAD(P) transhydrogenase subunit beta